jgi:hypothetical protein
VFIAIDYSMSALENYLLGVVTADGSLRENSDGGGQVIWYSSDFDWITEFWGTWAGEKGPVVRIEPKNLRCKPVYHMVFKGDIVRWMMSRGLRARKSTDQSATQKLGPLS